MRKLLLVILLVACVGIVGCAKEAEASVYEGDICDSHFASIFNKCHEVSTEKRRMEVGAGLDLIVYEGKDGELLNAVTGEYKYDWQNGEHQAYAVATVKLKDVTDKIKNLFKKDE